MLPRQLASALFARAMIFCVVIYASLLGRGRACSGWEHGYMRQGIVCSRCIQSLWWVVSGAIDVELACLSYLDRSWPSEMLRAPCDTNS